MEEIKIQTNSVEETKKLGSLLSSYLFPGAVITLSGDLGAGKTAFTGGIALGLGVKEKVSSPTFNIMKCYFDAKIPLFHIDAYRLEDGVNADIGLEEFIEGKGVAVIEWPNFIEKLIPPNILEIVILNTGDNSREITFKTNSKRYSDFFNTIKEMN